jgi:predicted O-methyltransferase YrrM
VPDLDELDAVADRIWPPQPRDALELRWREAEQRELLGRLGTHPPLRFRTQAGDDPTEYWTGNDQYPPLDAQVLAAMLRELRPRRMIEVGCGFSTLVSARVNREALGDEMHFTCVEPYPRQFLIDGVPGVTELRVEKVQEAPLELFSALGPGDVLFVDTSHTVKTGNDVVWVFFEVLPRLAPGVVVHLHDIFLPFDYPEVWVRQGRGWNEQYLLRAFLAYNDAFEIALATRFMTDRHPEAMRDTFGVESLDGGSFWMRRR